MTITSNLSRICTAIFLVVLMICSSANLFSQLHGGDWGFGASTALLPGQHAVVLSTVSQNNIGSAQSMLGSYQYSTGSELSYMLSPTMQLQGGLGVGLVSFAKENGTAEDPRTTAALQLGVRNYLRNGSDVSPYLSLMLGYSLMPTVAIANSDTKCSIVSASLAFGAEAFVAKHAALYTQLGLSFASAAVQLTTAGALGTTTQSGTVTTIGLGASAVGLRIYW